MQETRWNNRYDIAVPFVLFVSVLALKWTTLGIPYYWDETIWIRGAYWLSKTHLIRVIPGLHPPAIFDYHPPILHFSTAVLFKLFGRAISVAHLLIVSFSVLGVYFTYLLGSLLYGRPSGIFAAAFLLLSPMYFAQSGMFLADLPVAALGVMCTYFAFRGLYIPYLICGIYLVFIKETSMAIVFSILAYFYVTEKRAGKETLIKILKYAAPVGILFSFFILQKITTGRFCHMDAWADQRRMLHEHWRGIMNATTSITTWLFISQGRIWFSLLILLNFAMHKTSRRRKEHLIFLFMLCASGYSYSIIQFLPRYLLPIFPFFCILTGWSLSRLIPSIKIQAVVALILCAILIRSFNGRRIIGTSEWNMQYLDVVAVQRKMSARIEKEFSTSRVLTSWPYTEQLSRPYLGYVRNPLTVDYFQPGMEITDTDVIYWSEPPTQGSETIKQYVARYKLPALGRVENGKVKSALYAVKKQ